MYERDPLEGDDPKYEHPLYVECITYRVEWIINITFTLTLC